jgi:hypothetical protein
VQRDVARLLGRDQHLLGCAARRVGLEWARAGAK